MKKTYLIIGGVIIGLAIIGWVLIQKTNNFNLGLADSSFKKYATDVIGTKSATTTAGVGFSITSTGGQSATSTYVTRIGGNKNQAIYTNNIKSASTTANLLFAFEASNDDYCDTATSSPDVGDPVITGDINWFDIANNFTNKTHATSFDNASTTLAWTNPKAGAKETIVLDNLNYECLRLSVSGSSTVLHTQIRTK